MPRRIQLRFRERNQRLPMSGLVPQSPTIPALFEARPACEWVLPRAVLPQRDYCRTYRALPPGKPDCLSVSTAYTDGGVERCVAAVYGARAYLIHYAFQIADSD